MNPTSTLSYQGTTIRLRGAMLNLTDMWRAAGGPENRRPADWLILDETVRFRAHARTHWTELEEPVTDNAVLDGIIRIDDDGFVATLRGRHGGTWANWQLRCPMLGTSAGYLVRFMRMSEFRAFQGAVLEYRRRD